jgi:hypothetical protein
MRLKIFRMVAALTRVLMIPAPASPPAKEAAAAGSTNHQLMVDKEAYPIKPVKEEKQTMKVEDAAAILVGVLRT